MKIYIIGMKQAKKLIINITNITPKKIIVL